MFLIKPRIGTEILENMSFKHFAISTTNDAIWAGEQEQKLKKWYKKDTRGDNFTHTGTPPPRWQLNVQKQIYHEGLRRRCTHLFHILSNPLIAFGAVKDQNSGFPLSVTVAATTRQRCL